MLSSGRGIERLRTRRRKNRRRALIALVILIALLVGAAVWGLWQNGVRVSHIAVFDADPSLAAYATSALEGSYAGIIPRDSTFFLPEQQIRTAILAAHPEIAAVALFRDGFSGLSIRADERVPIARWCGASPDAPLSPCYLFDADGFIYATTSAPSSATTTTAALAAQPLNPFIVYIPLTSSSTPLGLTLPDADNLPAAFAFARKLGTFGSTVDALAIHDGQIDDLLSSGTRVTYLIGDEQNAFAALSSGRADLNLSDGSINYVDLRFGAKIYLKKNIE